MDRRNPFLEGQRQLARVKASRDLAGMMSALTVECEDLYSELSLEDKGATPNREELLVSRRPGAPLTLAEEGEGYEELPALSMLPPQNIRTKFDFQQLSSEPSNFASSEAGAGAGAVETYAPLVTLGLNRTLDDNSFDKGFKLSLGITPSDVQPRLPIITNHNDGMSYFQREKIVQNLKKHLEQPCVSDGLLVFDNNSDSSDAEEDVVVKALSLVAKKKKETKKKETKKKGSPRVKVAKKSRGSEASVEGAPLKRRHVISGNGDMGALASLLELGSIDMPVAVSASRVCPVVPFAFPGASSAAPRPLDPYPYLTRMADTAPPVLLPGNPESATKEEMVLSPSTGPVNSDWLEAVLANDPLFLPSTCATEAGSPERPGYPSTIGELSPDRATVLGRPLGF